MNYVFKNEKQEWEALRMYTFKKYEDGVYYRDAVLASDENIKMNLADITLPNGILRIDRNISTSPAELRLGHYSLPALNGSIKKQTRKIKGHTVQIIDNGVYQLALVSLKGWGKVETINSEGLNPVAEKSSVINVADTFVPDKANDNLYATLMLWKKSGEQWTNKELVPLKKLKYSDNKVEVSFVGGDKRSVNFGN